MTKYQVKLDRKKQKMFEACVDNAFGAQLQQVTEMLMVEMGIHAEKPLKQLPGLFAEIFRVNRSRVRREHGGVV